VTAPSSRPVPGASRPYHFPSFERTRLPNGLELVVATVRRLPLASIRIVLDLGARNETREEAGIAALTAAALAEGTTRLDAAALAEEFERLGGSLATYATWDATQARTTVMSDRLQPALALLAEVIRLPAFATREVERLRDERLAELLEQRSEPRGLADERFSSWLYKSASRLSIQDGGSERTVARLAADSCRQWHAGRFGPTLSSVVIAGDVDLKDAEAMVQEVLGDWTARPVRKAEVDDSQRILEPTVRLLHRAGAPQTELRLGHVGPRRATPDYFDVVVMNAILGGVFNSRINMNLRERNAFTYGAFSAFDWRRDAGPFVVSTAVATGVTGAAVREIVYELERMRAAPPTEDELSLATSYLDGVFPIRFETTDAIAGAIASLRTLRLPDTFYDTYRDRIRDVTLESVAQAAQNHIHLDRLQVLAVGDRDHVAAALDLPGFGPLGDVIEDGDGG
jgi:zinc protease